MLMLSISACSRWCVADHIHKEIGYLFLDIPCRTVDYESINLISMTIR